MSDTVNNEAIVIGESNIQRSEHLTINSPQDVLVSDSELYLSHIDYFFEKHILSEIDNMSDAEKNELFEMVDKHSNLLLKLVPYQYKLFRYAAGQEISNDNVGTFGTTDDKLLNDFISWKQNASNKE